MIICQALTWAQTKLNKAKINSTNLDTEILLSYIIKKNKTFLYSHPEHQLTQSQITKFKKLINCRVKGEPIAYLIGSKEFYGLNFIVNKHVLIPRPETELLVDEILKQVKKNQCQKSNAKRQVSLADIGTGSGCIAVSLAKNNPKLKIYASDISSQALTVAKKNNKLHRTKIIFKKGNLLKHFKNIKLTAIAANLPYLDIKHKNLLNSSETIGLKFEPTIALYSGPDGLDAYRQLFEQIKQLKYTPNFIYLEIGHLQITLIKKIINTAFPYAKISIKKDLAGLNRLAIVKFK